MSLLISRRMLLAAGLASWATKGLAAARPYDLVAERSRVSFIFSFNGAAQTGTVPVRTADIRVDPNNLAASSADVTTDIRQAKAGLLFVKQALLSPSVLDAENHPIVRYTTTRIILGARGRISEGAQVDGALTLRGVTRALRLNAELTRPAGTAANDLSVLNIRLTGALSRSEFGAAGFPKLAADRVDLDILAEIRARG